MKSFYELKQTYEIVAEMQVGEVSEQLGLPPEERDPRFLDFFSLYVTYRTTPKVFPLRDETQWLEGVHGRVKVMVLRLVETKGKVMNRDFPRQCSSDKPQRRGK